MYSLITSLLLHDSRRWKYKRQGPVFHYNIWMDWPTDWLTNYYIKIPKRRNIACKQRISNFNSIKMQQSSLHSYHIIIIGRISIFMLSIRSTLDSCMMPLEMHTTIDKLNEPTLQLYDYVFCKAVFTILKYLTWDSVKLKKYF